MCKQKRKQLAFISSKVDKELLSILSNSYQVKIIKESQKDWFLEHHKTFDRVIYLLSNKYEDKFVVKLSKKIEGILLLNDFYFDSFKQEIYKNYGYKAFLYKKQKFPIGKDILNKAIAIFFYDKNFLKDAKDFYYFLDEEKWFNIFKDESILQTIEKCYKDDYLYRLPSNITPSVRAYAYSSHDTIRQKQILVDISSLVNIDLKTGIQRVVKSQLLHLIKSSPLNIRIEPVYLKNMDGKYSYFYAREFMLSFLNIKDISLKDEAIDIDKGDIFYGLDLVAREVSRALKYGIYDLFKEVGVKTIFVVYDLIAAKNPHFFPKGNSQLYQRWIKDISKAGDILLCISKAVADELSKEVTHKDIRYLHLGADIVKKPLKKYEDLKKTTFLVVSTIEPRKAHHQVLEVFEKLWDEDFDIDLVFIGREGWMVEELLQKIENHPLKDKNFFYLKQVDDDTLQRYYLTSSALIVPSFAEGFGLPIIEAAFYELPIIARDIPVFREVAQDFAFYFKDKEDPKVLYEAIKTWLKLYKEDKHPKTSGMPYLTWQENAKQLITLFEDTTLTQN